MGEHLERGGEGCMSNDVYLNDLIGVPFKDKGRDKSGADCWGATMLVFDRFGIKLPDKLLSCFETDKINKEIDKDRGVDWMRLDEPEIPCLVVMKGIDPALPRACSHLGVFVGNGFFIHTMIKRNLLRERIDHPLFKNKIEGFYRYVGNAPK